MAAVLTALSAALGAWWASRQAKAKAEHELAVTEIKAGIRGGDRELRRLLALVVLGPLVLTVVAPEWGALVFERLAVLPAWYVEAVMLVMVSVFGLSVAKEILPSMLERLLRAWRK